MAKAKGTSVRRKRKPLSATFDVRIEARRRKDGSFSIRFKLQGFGERFTFPEGAVEDGRWRRLPGTYETAADAAADVWAQAFRLRWRFRRWLEKEEGRPRRPGREIEAFLARQPRTEDGRLVEHILFALQDAVGDLDEPGDLAADARERLLAARNALVRFPRLVRDAYERLDELVLERRHPAFASLVRRAFEGNEIRWATEAVAHLASGNDPAFRDVPIELVAMLFRDAARRVESPKGGAGNKGTWLLLAKLTLATGALMAQRRQKPTSQELSREQARLRRHCAREA